MTNEHIEKLRELIEFVAQLRNRWLSGDELQRFIGARNTLEEGATHLIDEVMKLRGALAQCARPYFWCEDGFWPDASTPAYRDQEMDRRRHIAQAALNGSAMAHDATYTIDELDEAIRLIAGDHAVRLDEPGWNRPRAALSAAATAWTDDRPEDEHSMRLRQAIHDMNRLGHLKPRDGVFP